MVCPFCSFSLFPIDLRFCTFHATVAVSQSNWLLQWGHTNQAQAAFVIHSHVLDFTHFLDRAKRYVGKIVVYPVVVHHAMENRFSVYRVLFFERCHDTSL
jgi:hypothetical protein